jgi:hypothetical protein
MSARIEQLVPAAICGHAGTRLWAYASDREIADRVGLNVESSVRTARADIGARHRLSATSPNLRTRPLPSQSLHI